VVALESEAAWPDFCAVVAVGWGRVSDSVLLLQFFVSCSLLRSFACLCARRGPGRCFRGLPRRLNGRSIHDLGWDVPYRPGIGSAMTGWARSAVTLYLGRSNGDGLGLMV
jgi:hypothetical protein